MTEPNIAAPPALFVSFARGDFRVSRLFERLEAQDMSVWNYDKPSQAVPLTANLKDHLRQQLEKSQACLVVVSKEAFDNEIVRFEIRQAIALRDQGRLKLCVFEDLELKQSGQAWPAPHDQLREQRYATVDLNDRLSISAAVAELCTLMAISYRPCFEEPGRTPLIARFYRELEGAVPRVTNRDNDRFQYLVQLLEQSHEAELAHDGDAARRILRLAVSLTEHEYPEVTLYYPAVIQALHRAHAGDPLGARDELMALDENSVPNAAIREDPCLPSALGFVCYQLGRFKEASEYYERSLELPDADVADHTSLLLSDLRQGKAVNLEERFAAIDAAAHLKGDAPNITYSKAIALRLANRPEAAAKLLVEWLDAYPDHDMFDDVLEEYARVLLGLSAPSDAEQRLRSRIDSDSPSPVARRALAKLLRDTGRTQEAQVLFSRLIPDCVDDADNAYEVMCGLWKLGAVREARQLAELCLESWPPPSTPWQYYVSGAANYILNRMARADCDFHRSGNKNHYRTYLPAP